MSPIINPLYLGYSSYKGVTYRIKLNGNLDFSPNARLGMGARLGYSFKLRQVYFNIPMRLTLGRRLTIETEYGTGNHIFNSEILTQLKHESYDSIRWENLRLDLFKDMYWRLRTSFLINPRLRLGAGFAYHRRTAVDPQDFAATGRKPKYYSFSPTLQLVWSPWLNRGPVLTYDYERGIKGVIRSDMNYERMEIDASWKIPVMKLRVLSMKMGYGIYTSRSKGAYFLDYRNFRYNSIPEGWNDDWTGEFQLLNKNWYNASKYYVNSNLTYESPLLLVSRIPFVGKFIEMERLYCNTLFTDKLHPYLECGYGLTNRLFSIGLFLGVSNKHFEGTGIRMSMELFRDWGIKKNDNKTTHMSSLTVYKASAGSGKTFTLAVAYIKLLVANPASYRNILAVTFTNKATEEMKTRILSQLYGISRGLAESDDYLKKIALETQMAEDDIRKAASAALSLLIHNYDYFHVETIDTFFQSVLRNLARELDLSANLRVELNDTAVENQAVDLMIE
ncbi:MAG: DUF5686 family protein, partial [Prevotella pectinovora]